MSDPELQLIGDDGRKYPFKSGGLAIGSHDSNDVVIKNHQVSNNHARIILAAGRCWVRDENSQVGTYVNDQLIPGLRELRPGDKLQIGPEIFRLALVSSTVTAQNNSRRGILFVSIAAPVLILFILLVGSSGLFRSGLIFVPTVQFTPSLTVNHNKAVATLPVSPSPELTTTMNATNVPTPLLLASISCENLQQYLDIRSCVVTNLGTMPVTLWLSFTPHRLDKTNDFNLSIALQGKQDTIFPDRRGEINLGLFEPGSQRIVRLQMICVDTLYGCPLTTIRVQLLVGDQKQPISGLESSLVIYNIAVVKTATPTLDAVEEPLATQAPIVSTPTLTSTSSDAYGPTATP